MHGMCRNSFCAEICTCGDSPQVTKLDMEGGLFGDAEFAEKIEGI